MGGFPSAPEVIWPGTGNRTGRADVTRARSVRNGTNGQETGSSTTTGISRLVFFW